jgi:pimeloyl-ACP methyl ester carboxylesterase
VLWGLARRFLPRVMRLPPARAAAVRLFGVGAFQRRFWRRHVGLPWPHPLRAPFFDGYARCAAFADLFRWIGPAWLRELETKLRAREGALRDISVWWGGRDTVMSTSELRVTEAALGVQLPLRVFPDWGHYPMLTDPAGWVAALAAEVR